LNLLSFLNFIIYLLRAFMETKKLFIGGLSWNLDWQEVKDIFKEY
jgi:RNA recognition motif-containing protein